MSVQSNNNNGCAVVKISQHALSNKFTQNSKTHYFVYVHPLTLTELKLGPGSLAFVAVPKTLPHSVPVLVWPSKVLGQGTITISPLLKSQYQFGVGDPISLSSPQSATRVITQPDAVIQVVVLASSERVSQPILQLILMSQSVGTICCPSMQLMLRVYGKPVIVKVCRIMLSQGVVLSCENMSASEDDSLILYEIQTSTRFEICEMEPTNACTVSNEFSFQLEKLSLSEETQQTIAFPSSRREGTTDLNFKTSFGFHKVGGLVEQKAQLGEFIVAMKQNSSLLQKLNLQIVKGALLHGPKGVGKSFLARSVAVEFGLNLVVVSSDARDEDLLHKFSLAKKSAPSLLLFDDIDILIQNPLTSNLSATLEEEMDKLKPRDRVFSLATTSSLESLDPSLRRPGRFGKEIEITIPSMKERELILNTLVQDMPHNISPEQIQHISQITPGFLPSDLVAMIHEASLTLAKAILPLNWESLPQNNNPKTQQHTFPDPVLGFDNIIEGLRHVTPSTLKSITIEVPVTVWSDVGGNADVKTRLKEGIELPLKHPGLYEKMGVQPLKGCLMYGPPGCSKTLMAKALAHEASVNFLAVKGPELLSKWVGESEKAIKEIFRKARAAAPSIIFFDEIDAIALSRAEGEVTDRVLTELLIQMDGITKLDSVLVVAATNRPDLLDEGLLRPGRIDRILYVGPPDLAARKEIFLIHLKNVPLAPNIDLDELAKISEGFSGAEIMGVVKEAALAALSEDLHAACLTQVHLLAAAKRVKPSITPEMIQYYSDYKKKSQVSTL